MFMDKKRVLLTGATGFIGGRLLRRLQEQGATVRCLVRSAKKFQSVFGAQTGLEVVEGDLVQGTGLDEAMQGVWACYYLVHSMGPAQGKGGGEFAQKDRQAAENFRQAAEASGMQRVVYLSGLGDRNAALSHHLSSRQEVGHILASGSLAVTELRAGVIIGSGGASFEMIRYLTERLPVIIGPKWLKTLCQPIAVENVLDYLLGCLEVPETANRVLEICGPDRSTYRELMLTYAQVRGLRRLIFTVPLFTPKLASYWVQLITPVPSSLVRPLIAGLKNEVTCRDEQILSLIPIRRIPVQEALCTAMAEEEKGPGAIPSMQACFFKE